MKTKYVIKDWAGNLIRFKNRPDIFNSFADAEEVLCEELNDNYEIDRQEYEIDSIEVF